MSDWVKLNPSEFNKPEHVSVNGADIEVFLSPYDMPEAFRGSFIKQEGKFEIEFKYIGGNEPLEAKKVKDGSMLLQIGRHSKRLYRILLDIEPDKREVTLSLLLPKFNKQLETLTRALGSDVPERNYKVTKEILAKKGNQILQDAYAA